MGETAENGLDVSEMNAMIEANLPLVKHIVLQVAVHFPRHVEREELARAGALGLVEAARRYDESRGVPFDRFAAQRIRGATSMPSAPPTGRPVRCVRWLASSKLPSSVSLAGSVACRPPKRWPRR